MPSKKDEDDDPVVDEYDVFVTNNLIEKYYLLQFPSRNRERPYNEDNLNKPVGVRFKPRTGFLELDVPLNTEINFNQSKAREWGDALSKNQRSGGTGVNGYGIAVGFSQATRGQPGRRPHPGPSEAEDGSRDGPGLERQTLGGQMVHEERGKPNYMIGTFLTDKRELHLTELAGVVQMRPQFHHIDAKIQADKAKVRREREASEAPVSKSSIVQMSYTSTDHDQNESATTKALLHAAHEEPWGQLMFYDEEEGDSYLSYHEHLFLPPAQQHVELMAAMDNDRYLDAISAPRLDHRGVPRTKPMTKKQKAQIALSDHEESGNENENENGPNLDQVTT